MVSSKKSKEIGLLNDNAENLIQNDKFGFDAYVDILEASITATESLPFTVGIFGEWGTGKTTLMKFLQQKFESRGYKTIWLNPWKYDTREDIRKALITSILLELKKIYKNNKSDLISVLLKDTAWIAAEKGITYLTGGILLGLVDNARERIIEAKQKEMEFINQFEEKFKQLINNLVGDDGRLILFIDDLDRCLPENTTVILESLKLFLDEPHCIFILGMDRKIVEQAIKIRYKDITDFSGTDYLDKIIQLPFFIPPIQYEKLKVYLEESTKLVSDYDDNIWSLIDYGFAGNPRKVKRFVNCYYLLQKALDSRTILEQYSDKESVDEFNRYPKKDRLFFLAKILIIRMIYTEFYDYLVYNNQVLDHFEQAVIDGTEGILDKEIIISYPELEPYLKMRDLRKFFENTSCGTNVFPQTPPLSVIKYLLLLTGLVEGGKSTPAIKSEVTTTSGSPINISGLSNRDSYIPQSQPTDTYRKP